MFASTAACNNCGTAVRQEGSTWRHIDTGTFRCPWPHDGDGWAVPHEQINEAELREQIREELYDEFADNR